MLSEGQAFSHFKIKRLLGRGGMGEVYLAEDEKLGREVAIKILSGELFSDADKLKRFHRESRTAAQVSNPYVMSIYDIGSAPATEGDEDVHYIVMEYIRGQSLSAWLNQRRPDLPMVLRIAEKIAAGLAAAHKLNIVHRDIKADNIIVDENEDPRILDFGLAKPLESSGVRTDSEKTDTVSEELTQAGKIIGTVSYMSPEQARGESVDTRSDVFSFGVLLYRMATGEFPFAGETQVSTLAKILETRHEPLRSKDTSLPPELERIVDKCLQKKPDDRYQNTTDLVLDIRSLRRQYDSGITETVSGVSSRMAAGRSGRWRTFGLVAVAVVVVAVVSVILSTVDFSGSGGGQAVRAAGNSLAIIGFENKTGNPSLDWLKSGLPEVLLTDLSQSDAINVVSPRRMDDHMVARGYGERGGEYSYENYLKCAIDIGAVNVLSGSYFRLGTRIRIDARIEEVATGRIVLAEKVVGEDAFVLVDSLSEKIAASLDILESMRGATNASEFASASPAAYRLYLEGLELFDRELYDSAISQFHRAIALDSSFALPYMRIGMALVFQGRQQDGQQWFLMATEREGKLPVKDRTLLDVYRDTWVHQQFDAAYTKLQSFVRSYPEDPEGRVIYGIFKYQIMRDSTAALAEFDTALALQPGYQLAFAQYVNLYLSYENDMKALEYAKRLQETRPESPSGYILVGSVNRRLGRLDEAIANYQELLERFPTHRTPYNALADIYITTRDFDKARDYLARFRAVLGDDPLVLGSYYSSMANIAVWDGEIRQAFELTRERLNVYLQTGDSTRIMGAYSSLGNLHRIVGMTDSSLAMYRKGHEWATLVQKLNYPMTAVSIDHSLADELRPLMKEASTAFRAAVPSNMWPLVDLIEESFEAAAAADTARMIDVAAKVADSPFASDTEHDMAKLYVASGQYQRAWDLYEKIYSNPNPVWSATRYLPAQYYRGFAAEQLGMKTEAIRLYQEVLEYWGDVDMPIEEATLARERLARLQS